MSVMLQGNRVCSIIRYLGLCFKQPVEYLKSNIESQFSVTRKANLPGVEDNIYHLIAEKTESKDKHVCYPLHRFDHI